MPKSRGRRKPSGAKKPVRRAPGPQRLSDRVLPEARALHVSTGDVLQAEVWASGVLGAAWSAAGMTEREPEETLCLEVAGRASTRPSASGLAAVAALERVTPGRSRSMLRGTVEILAESQPLPTWFGEPEHRAVRAWCAVDVWDSERVLFIAYDGPVPHTLMVQVDEVGGTLLGKLALLAPNAALAWEDMHEPDAVPMPLTEQPVEDTLSDLAAGLRVTDMTWPRQDDPDFIELRALAWARSRDHLPDWPDHQPLDTGERERLLDSFTASGVRATEQGDTDVLRSLGELFLDYGENYLSRGPLAWSPSQVAIFLGDWLPRKAVLDRDQRRLLPDALEQWVRFALTERGVAPKWITPVAAAVKTHMPGFRAAFDDSSAWGPAKQAAAALTARGVDPRDRNAVDAALRALNAEQLAHRLSTPLDSQDT
ncbi:hypothetical protein [Peterkaempfera sp. SMS 1(5)a]|uniref:hypothetical protein n=1 Tax=Peterkaempfera podocarpi TaxID=3232308 RepID=UPI003671912B